MMPTPTDQGIAEGVRWLLEQQTLVRAPLPAPLPTPISGAGGAPTVVVGAYNCTLLSQNKSDLFCTGRDDDGTLLIALSILQSKVNDAGGSISGRVLLTEGDFYLPSTTVLYRGVRFEGMGRDATRLHSQTMVGSSTPVNATMFHVEHTPGVGSVEPISFSHLSLDGHKAIQTAGSPHGIFCEPNGSAFISLNDVAIRDFRGSGLASSRSADTIAIDRSSLTGNTGDGVFFEFEGDLFITNSDISGNTGRGIKADGGNLKLAGCTIRGNGSHGFSAGGVFEGTPKLIVGNEFANNGGYGIDWDALNGVIAGNHIEGNTQDGLIVFANQPVSIVGNTIVGNTLRGATLVGGGGNQGGVFEGNVVRMNGQHGIYVDSDDWTVEGNRVNNNSRMTTNTYDGIHIAGGVDSRVLTNMVRQTVGAPVQRYGINITAGATGTQRAGNDCRGGGFGTAAYVDAGTASILDWAGAGGNDNI